MKPIITSQCPLLSTLISLFREQQIAVALGNLPSSVGLAVITAQPHLIARLTALIIDERSESLASFERGRVYPQVAIITCNSQRYVREEGTAFVPLQKQSLEKSGRAGYYRKV